MTELLFILIPIALLDSTSIIPLCIVLLIVLLSGPGPLIRSSMLIAGIFVTYLACGLLILFGLDSLFDALEAYAMRVWQNPNAWELLFQILVGLVLLAVAWRMTRKTPKSADKPATAGMTGTQAFTAGVGLTIVGLPGAVPYFGAINLIIRDELTFAQEIVALVVYNIFFVVPLAAIVVLRQVMGEASQSLLERVRAVFDTWGTRVVIALIVALGAVLVADGLGWFLGYPLIPV
ncbi:MAG: GAP family protein [Pseudomonadota bacterium]